MPDQTPQIWRPDRAGAAAQLPPGGPQVPMALALWRGLRCVCPGCGQTAIFRGYSTVTGPCPVCGSKLNEARADDAPPYFTILLTGHIIIPLMLLTDTLFAPRDWVQAAFWVPATLALTIGLLRPIKGATIALMLRLNMLKPEDEA